MFKMINIITALSIIFISTGCKLVSFVDSDTITTEQKANIIYTGAKGTTIVTMKQLFKNDPAKMNEVAERLSNAMEKYALPIINNPDQSILTGETFMRVIADSPPDIIPIVSAAYLAAQTYLHVASPNEILTPEQIVLIKALFNGLNDGAKIILEVQ